MTKLNQNECEILATLNTIPALYLVGELNKRQTAGRIKLWINGYDNKLEVERKKCETPCPVHCKEN